MLWVGVHKDNGEGTVACFFTSLSTASRSDVIIRNCHENKSVKGYEPDILRILTPPTTLHNPPRSLRIRSTILSLPTIPPHHSPFIIKLNRVFLRFRIRSIPLQRHSFIHLRDRRIENRGTTDVEVEYLGTGLAPYEPGGL